MMETTNEPPWLENYVRRILGPKHADDAEDVLQDARIKQMVGGYRQKITVIARSMAIDHLRRCRRKKHGGESVISLQEFPQDPSCEDDPLEALIEDETREDVKGAIAGLSEAKQRAVIGVFFEGMSYEDVARMDGSPVNTVKSRLHQAKEQMQPSLRRYA